MELSETSQSSWVGGAFSSDPLQVFQDFQDLSWNQFNAFPGVEKSHVEVIKQKTELFKVSK